MPSDASILTEFDEAFATCLRPEHFTDYTHCDEFPNHDLVLRSRDVCTLSMDDVGHPSWNPIAFITPVGFAYYLPALARLSLTEPLEGYDLYGLELLRQLRNLGYDNE